MSRERLGLLSAMFIAITLGMPSFLLAQVPSADELLRGVNEYANSWHSFRAEFEETRHHRRQEAGEWTKFYWSFGRFELHDERVQYLQYSIDQPIRHPDYAAALFNNLMYLDDGPILRISKKHDSPSMKALERESKTIPELESATYQIVTLTSKHRAVPLVASFFPYFGIDNLGLTSALDAGTNTRELSNAVFGDVSCIRLAFRDQRGKHEILFAPSLDFAPVKYVREVSGTNDFFGTRLVDLEPFGKPLVRLRWQWEMQDPPSRHFGGVWETQRRYEHKDGEIIDERSTMHVTDVDRPLARRSPLWSPPPNGTKVVLMDHQQIAAEWRDGEILKTYDGKVVERLAKVEFQQPSSPLSMYLWAFAAVVVVAVMIAIIIAARIPRR